MSQLGGAVLGFLVAAGGAEGSGGQMMPADPAQESALLRLAGSGFSIKRTAHFVIAYDADPSVVQDLTGRLEHTYHMVYRFCEINEIDVRRPDRRLEVLFFDQRAAYDGYGVSIGFRSAGTHGVYFEATNRSAFFNAANDPEMRRLEAEIAAARRNIDGLAETMANIRDGRVRVEIRFSDGRRIVGTRAQVEKQLNREIGSVRKELRELDGRSKVYADHINRTVIQHETAHQVFYNVGIHVRRAGNPKWLVEGLACLFETPPGRTGTGFAAVNQLRLRDFRSAVAGESDKRRLTWQDYERSLAAGRMPSPRQLILEPQLLAARGSVGATRYAATWALMLFVQRVHGKQLAGYLQEVGARRPGDEPAPAEELALFEKHFGPIDETFLRRFSGYVLGLSQSASPGEL